MNGKVTEERRVLWSGLLGEKYGRRNGVKDKKGNNAGSGGLVGTRNWHMKLNMSPPILRKSRDLGGRKRGAGESPGEESVLSQKLGRFQKK